MQLLLILLLLSAQGSGLGGGIKPLLETMGGEEIKNAINEAEQIAEVMQLAKILMPQASSSENFQTTTEENFGKNEAKSPLFEVTPFADPEITAAINEALNEALYNM